ncbi:hypothetical protein A3D00_01915 [Candidatus Woesebacteria bacterium RIFCSPHIGHO2_02_FULL_38_9]|uniref:Glycosyltransferase RgtA/B/C/D-like domain-containing protein n=1 Tax=Candidatus Woesebacteria bacterium RIFCSPHIGHO2_01_FULL_39_28 TaxID=1802496 RepID=A0A1F7YIK4_9BACT|nr:MAG: hypothetical protein A2627_02475 [Candidatus Woesebacteria bacterium RIFCSPHIGHO2_01_FULL_39_28]OGM32206.1 MAG: hypothetical protein A3D00_01915 [Candidatus Woesebacteria bacterium RIFCSPHIGHO2_02_FULL_38_9]OGM57193.1 MAG: hypothetical protein A3A50_03335 [Candidatus Woesebacteria bacterium RIFCSPLOWO2_01_FULL_38_20]
MRSKKLILLILVLALIVRIWGVNFGLPQKHIIDEQAIVYSVFYAANYKLNAGLYLHAPLLPYILLFEYGCYFIVGRIIGIFSSTNDFAVSYLKDPTTLFLLGRLTGVLFGVGTVFLTYLIGEKFFKKYVGIIAAFLLAFIFLHVKESHYIKEDVIAGFFVLSVYYFSLRIKSYGKLKDYLLAGSLIALAISAKYTSVVVIPAMLIAHFFNKKRKFINLFYAGLFGLLVFLLINLYLVLNFKSTYDWINSQFVGNRISYDLILAGKPAWWWFLLVNIPQGVGAPLFIAAVIGFLFTPILSIVPLTFLFTVDLWTKYKSARLAISLLPFFALATAVIFEKLQTLIKNRKIKLILVPSLMILIIYPSLSGTVKFDFLLTRSDTRKEASNWFTDNIDKDVKVVVEGTFKPEFPSNTNIYILPDRVELSRRINQSKNIGFDATYIKAFQEAVKDQKGFEIISTPRVDMLYDEVTNEEKLLGSAEYYSNLNIDYLVLSSWTNKPNVNKEFQSSIEKYYHLIKEFKPTYEFPLDPHFIEVDYNILDRVDLLGKNIIFGPVISIYQKN